MEAVAPIAQWQYAVDAGDWQPFTMSVSGSLEIAYQAFGSGGPPTTQVRTGVVDHAIDFPTMRRSSPSNLLPPGEVRRKEYFTVGDVALLRAEFDRLRRERDGLKEELDLLVGPGGHAGMSATPSNASRGGDMAVTTISWCSTKTANKDLLLPPAQAPAATGTSWCSENRPPPTETSCATWVSAASNCTGLFALSAASLESIASNVFRLNAQALPQAKDYTRVLINEGDLRKQWLEDYLTNSLRPHRRAYNSEDWCAPAQIRIMRIHEVINPQANCAYLREIDQMRSARLGDRSTIEELAQALRLRSDGSGPRLNEALLFHGCKWEAQFAILREGFDSRLGGTSHGASFGIGSYFSTVASKADQYTQRWADWERRPPVDCPTNLRCMIIARVALGEAHEMPRADPTLRRPPLARDGVRCDSVLGLPRQRGGCVDYDEFVIYKPHQATPQFMVEYEHKQGCECRTCAHPWC